MDVTRRLAEGLRASLLATNYTDEHVKGTLGTESPLDYLAPHLKFPHLLQAAGLTELPPLVRLFYICQPVGADELEPALQPPATLAELTRLGLVSVAAGRVIPRIRITPLDDLFVAHDPDDNAEFQPDHVVGVGPAAKSLAALTVRPQVASALDLGTGAGVQALLSARHAKRVSATDISERALTFARLNIQLNAMDNVELLNGDLFAPVAGRTFDLIVANPPFVLSPEREYVFRDSGRPGDSLSREVLQETPRFLNERGFAHVLCSWVCQNEAGWSLPVERWLEGSGCDAWVLCNSVDSPLAYAAEWNRPLLRKSADAFAGAVARWTEFYQREGIERICTGAVILRRRTTKQNWVRTDMMPSRPTGPAGNHIMRVFEAQDNLSAIRSNRRLLEDAFALVDGHWLDQRMVYRGGRYQTSAVRLHLESGVGLSGEVDPLATHVLFRMDGRRSLRDLIREAARDTGLSSKQLTDVTVGAVRQLYALGLLAPGQGVS